MFFPPSISQTLISRAFRAANGELGIVPADVFLFLDACETGRVDVLGWELWLIDHEWNAKLNDPEPAAGCWCGLIPLRRTSVPGVVHGEGNLASLRAELANLDLNRLVETRWLEYLRVNFSLDA